MFGDRKSVNQFILPQKTHLFRGGYEMTFT